MDQYYMLTTTDNPFNPFTSYDAWDAWDRAHGYCSNALLARVAFTTSELSDEDYDQEVQDAIDEIVTNNVSGMHTKVARPSSDQQQAA